MKTSNKTIFSKFENFMSSWRFPIFAISLLAFFSLLLGIILLIPNEGTQLSSFAQDFKTWCFGYNTHDGSWQWAYFIMFFFGPFLMISILYFVWIQPIKEIFKEAPLKILPYIATPFMLVCLSCWFLFSLYKPSLSVTTKTLPFPGERIRMAIPSHDFTLIDHENNKITLQKLQNKVVLITGVYATCGST